MFYCSFSQDGQRSEARQRVVSRLLTRSGRLLGTGGLAYVLWALEGRRSSKRLVAQRGDRRAPHDGSPRDEFLGDQRRRAGPQVAAVAAAPQAALTPPGPGPSRAAMEGLVKAVGKATAPWWSATSYEDEADATDAAWVRTEVRFTGLVRGLCSPRRRFARRPAADPRSTKIRESVGARRRSRTLPSPKKQRDSWARAPSARSSASRTTGSAAFVERATLFPQSRRRCRLVFGKLSSEGARVSRCRRTPKR